MPREAAHADTACEAWERDKLERLCRYVARPALANEWLFQRPDGLLVYKMKKPYNDGTEYLLFSPEELLEKLAALVPIPRVHLTRFHGCLAPHAKIRKKVVPPREASEESKPSRKRMTWAQLLKRVFKAYLSRRLKIEERDGDGMGVSGNRKIDRYRGDKEEKSHPQRLGTPFWD